MLGAIRRGLTSFVNQFEESCLLIVNNSPLLQLITLQTFFYIKKFNPLQSSIIVNFEYRLGHPTFHMLPQYF